MLLKFAQSGIIVMDPFGSLFTIENVCMYVPMNRRCTEGDLDPAYVKHGMLQLLEVYKKQVLNPTHDISWTDAF